MSDNVAQLVTTKPDKEVAEELKQELLESSKGINAFGQCVVMSLTLSKHY